MKKAFTTPWLRGVSIGVVGFVMELYLLKKERIGKRLLYILKKARHFMLLKGVKKLDFCVVSL